MQRNLSLFPGRSTVCCPACFLYGYWRWRWFLPLQTFCQRLIRKAKWCDQRGAQDRWPSSATTSSYFSVQLFRISSISVWFLFTGYIISVTPLSSRCGWDRLAGITNWFGSDNQRRKHTSNKHKVQMVVKVFFNITRTWLGSCDEFKLSWLLLEACLK